MKKLFTSLMILTTVFFAFDTQAQCDECAKLKETVEWIEGKVKEHGNFIYYYRGENEIFDAEFSTGLSNCTWEYTFSERYYDDPERGKGRKPRTYKIKFKLKHITEVVMMPVEGQKQTGEVDLYYSIEFRTYNDKDKIKQKKKRYSRDRTNEVAILIADKEIAERMVVAFNCALCLCGEKGEIKEEAY